MGNRQWVIWSVFFALLANASSALGIHPAPDAAASVCDMQVAIAHALEKAPTHQHLLRDPQRYRHVDAASGTPVLPSQLSVGPGLAVLSVLRAPELPHPTAAAPAPERCILAALMGAEAVEVPWDTFETFRPPDNRYRYLLTPHAPPERV